MSKQTDTNVLRQKRAQLHQPVAPAIGRVRFAKLKMLGGKQCAGGAGGDADHWRHVAPTREAADSESAGHRIFRSFRAFRSRRKPPEPRADGDAEAFGV